jgi:c-di-GMP-binding flagellar brake protein YcgR
MNVTKSKNNQARIRVWERLQIVVGEAGKEGVYISRVLDISEDRLIISRPMFSYGRSLLADNRVVRASFTRADAAYSFSGRIKEIEPKSPDEMYLLNPGEIRRIQRRRFVRLDKIVRIRYMILPRPINKRIELKSGNFEKTVTVNISAGGLLLLVENRIAADDLLLIDFMQSGLKSVARYVMAVCRHVRVNEEKKQMAGVELILREDLALYLKPGEGAMIPKEARQFNLNIQNGLVGELFNEQLIMRQRGLL